MFKNIRIYLLAIMSLLCIFLTSSYAGEFTDPVFYQPFSHSKHKKDLVVSQTIKGECHRQSKNNPREDAWQCVAKGKTFDPCFQHSYMNKDQLICPLSPWHAKATKILVQNTLDNSQHAALDMSKHNPWAVELTNGLKCLKITNRRGSNHQYQCDNNFFLEGNFYRCKQKWEIYLTDDQQFEVAQVKKAWF